MDITYIGSVFNFLEVRILFLRQTSLIVEGEWPNSGVEGKEDYYLTREPVKNTLPLLVYRYTLKPSPIVIQTQLLEAFKGPQMVSRKCIWKWDAGSFGFR
jgi:hypothetical protein